MTEPMNDANPLSPSSSPAPARSGSIALVGIGPGHAAHMTARAREAIAQADVVIGYVTYIKLVADLLEGKEVIRKAMTEEIDRAISALEKARQGKKVALISSGDAGVYGMAGLIFDLLDGDSDRTPVEVIPGITALTAAAALLGAPLMSDFAAISLSNYLVEEATILKRLEAAARADFVICLYNPTSSKRRAFFETACAAVEKIVGGERPVGIVRSAYRDGQSVRRCRMAELRAAELGMDCVVIIGNSTTRFASGRMITARGYNLHKQSTETETLET